MPRRQPKWASDRTLDLIWEDGVEDFPLLNLFFATHDVSILYGTPKSCLYR